MTGLILFNANAITMDSAQPAAQLIAVEDGVISHVGGNELLQEIKRSTTRIVDCAGKTLVPGFIDAHCHVHAFAERLVSIDLSPRENVRSIHDLKDRIRARCAKLPPGRWIRGKGYNEFYLSEKRHPNRRDLDSAAPLHPVKLTHRSGHAHILNSLALRIAKIDETTGDPPEGLIDRDLDGQPTGILYGMGAWLAKRIPPLDSQEIERGVQLANARLLSLGITSVQDASIMNGPEQWDRMKDWKHRGLFHPRVTMMTGLEVFLNSNQTLRAHRGETRETELRPGPIKIIVDEATGSLRPSPEELAEAVFEIHRSGRQAAIHAIEETAVEAAVKAIESALRKMPRQDHRHRIEHCSVCPPGLLQNLKRLRIVIATQPGFIYHHGDRYLQTVQPDQIPHLYPCGSIIESGLAPAAGSDFPICAPDPPAGIYAAVTRRTESGSTVPGRIADAHGALRMHTINAAYACFEEGMKGSLSPGKLADIVMLSEDPVSIHPERIRDIKVLMTILSGRII